MAIPSSKDIKYWLFLVVFIIVIVLFLRLLQPFIAPLILSAIIVSIFTPAYNIINRWLPQSVASFICCGLICVVIFIPFVIVITILANQALTLYSNAMNSEFMQTLITEVDGNWIVSKVNAVFEKLNLGFTISGDEIYQFIGRLGSRFGSFLYSQATNITGNFIRLVINFCFMILISYYLFGNGRRVIDFFVGLSPLPEGHEVAMLQRLKTTAGAIFFGSFVSGLIQGTIGGITLWYFGFPAPFLWAVVMVILAFLPIVGIGMVFVPCIVITFMGGDYFQGIIMAVVYVASSSITEYIIIPRLEGKRSQMHTVLVFLSVLGGLQMFGIIGVLYGPLIITAFLALYELYRANYLETVEMMAAGYAGAVNAAPFMETGEPHEVVDRALRSMDQDVSDANKPAQPADADEDDNDIALGDDIEPEFNPATGELIGDGAKVVPETTFAQDAEARRMGGYISGLDNLNDALPAEDNDIAQGDDIEPEFDENTGETYDADYYAERRGDLASYPGGSYVDYPPGTPPVICSDADAEKDGLIWDDARPAHLPFPGAEGAEKLSAASGEEEPDVSIKDIIHADISSFKKIDDSIIEGQKSSGENSTKE